MSKLFQEGSKKAFNKIVDRNKEAKKIANSFIRNFTQKATPKHAIEKTEGFTPDSVRAVKAQEKFKKDKER